MVAVILQLPDQLLQFLLLLVQFSISLGRYSEFVLLSRLVCQQRVVHLIGNMLVVRFSMVILEVTLQAVVQQYLLLGDGSYLCLAFSKLNLAISRRELNDWILGSSSPYRKWQELFFDG